MQKRDSKTAEAAMTKSVRRKKSPDGTGVIQRSISLPEDLLRMLNVEARALNVGRSRLVAERLRRSYAAEEQNLRGSK